MGSTDLSGLRTTKKFDYVAILMYCEVENVQFCRRLNFRPSATQPKVTNNLAKKESQSSQPFLQKIKLKSVI